MDEVSRRIRSHILDISESSGHGHVPTCFSIIEILRAIYQVMRHEPKNPQLENRDLFILSKGHAALGHYCVLAEEGYFDIADVFQFGAYGSRFGCHADRHKVPGVEVSTGSLGHGISVAAGMALGLKIAGSKRRVFTLVGDGESNEGTVWETLMVASDQKLDNLTVIFDNNKSQGRCLSIPNLTDRVRSFGADVVQVPGHDMKQLTESLQQRPGHLNAVIAESEKGYGCKTLIKNMYEWHRRSPDRDMLITLKEELHAWPL
jgi:transketolase